MRTWACVLLIGFGYLSFTFCEVGESGSLRARGSPGDTAAGARGEAGVGGGQGGAAGCAPGRGAPRASPRPAPAPTPAPASALAPASAPASARAPAQLRPKASCHFPHANGEVGMTVHSAPEPPAAPKNPNNLHIYACMDVIYSVSPAVQAGCGYLQTERFRGAARQRPPPRRTALHAAGRGHR